MNMERLIEVMVKKMGEMQLDEKVQAKIVQALKNKAKASPELGYVTSTTKVGYGTQVKPFGSDVPVKMNFDGQNSWPAFKEHFQAMAELNQWDEEQMGLQLACCLRGDAVQIQFVLPEQQRWCFKSLVKHFDRKYGPRNPCRSKAMFCNVENSEKVRDFSYKLRRLDNNGQPRLEETGREIVKKNSRSERVAHVLDDGMANGNDVTSSFTNLNIDAKTFVPNINDEVFVSGKKEETAKKSPVAEKRAPDTNSVGEMAMGIVLCENVAPDMKYATEIVDDEVRTEEEPQVEIDEHVDPQPPASSPEKLFSSNKKEHINFQGNAVFVPSKKAETVEKSPKAEEQAPDTNSVGEMVMGNVLCEHVATEMEYATETVDDEVRTEEEPQVEIDEHVDPQPPASLPEKLFSSSKEEHINGNVVNIGHVDASKSTSGGQFVRLIGMVDKRTLYERDKENAVDVGRAYETDIFGAPGHTNFVSNQIKKTELVRVFDTTDFAVAPVKRPSRPALRWVFDPGGLILVGRDNANLNDLHFFRGLEGRPGDRRTFIILCNCFGREVIFELGGV